MTQGAPPPRLSIFGQARQLISGLVQLARLEVTRGRQEIGEMLAETRSGLVLIGIALVVALLALITFVMTVVLGIAALTGLPEWLVALIVLLIFIVLAGLLAFLGVRRIRIGPPEETIEAVKEDMAWVKRLIRRG
ncbi:MAG TPA: phage holin family protein [candidate division Zixibacteria bacterium]|nr:phage holin family protein [candidate division Zixibacteria bacterium]